MCIDTEQLSQGKLSPEVLHLQPLSFAPDQTASIQPVRPSNHGSDPLHLKRGTVDVPI